MYSSEVEAVLSAHPQIQQAAVFGIPNPIMGEMVHAAVVLHSNSPAVTSQQLIKWCHASLAAYKCPTSVHLMPELPLTGSGKVLKTALRASFAKGPVPKATPAVLTAAQASQTAQHNAAQHSAAQASQTAQHSEEEAKENRSAVATATSASAAASTKPSSGSGDVTVARCDLERLVVQFVEKEHMPVQIGSPLDAAKCYLIVVPDWSLFLHQVRHLLSTLVGSLAA